MNLIEQFEQPKTMKAGIPFLWGLGGFFCGIVFMFFLAMLAMV